MNQSKIKIGDLIESAAVIISGCIFVILASTWTSPVYKGAYGYDASWYSLMGRAIVEGKVPYKDYFDLKGPTLFFYEALGQLFIKDRGGVVLIQCISAGASAFLIYKLLRMYAGRVWSWISLVIFFFLYTGLLWGGNTAEELFLPLNMLCILLGVNFLRSKKYDETEVPAFIFGICFAVIFWGKMTVAAPLIAAAFTVFVVLLREKLYREVGKCFLYFCGGFTALTIPVLAYFAMRGAVSDLFLCVFWLGFRRGTDYYEGFSLDWEMRLLICIMVFVFGIAYATKKNAEFYKKCLLLSMAVITYVLLHFGTPFDYYFITELPLLVIFLCFVPETSTKMKKKASYLIPGIIGILALVTILAAYAPISIDKINENIWIATNNESYVYIGHVHEIYEEVPENERDDIFNLESGMIFYEILRKLPLNKYAVNMPYFLHLYPPIKTETLGILENKKPKWIISEDMESFDDDDIKDYVFRHYKLVKENGAEELYWRVM